MLDMLGEDARAAVGKVKQLQSQGATPEQIDMQLIDAARNGLLPISVAFAAQKALQRQNPTPPPPQGTVVGDMMQQLSARQQGVAALPNPVMDTSQFAGGGIVAFSTGGATSIIEDPITGDVFEVDASGKHTRLGKAYVDPTSGERFVNTANGPRSINPRVPSTPAPAPTQSRWSKVKGAATRAGNYDVGAAAKNALSKVTVGGVARGIGGGALAGGILEGIDVARGKEVDTETMRDYYGMDDGPGAIATGIASLYGGGENEAQLLSDLGVRALGTGQRLLTLGLTGPERPDDAAAAAAAQQKPAAPAVALPSLDKFGDPMLAQLDGLGALAQGPGMKGYRGQMEQYLAQSQQGVPTEAPKMDAAVKARRKLNEDYGVYAPITAAEERIAKRRAKAEAEGGKSVLTELGLAFLTKGVMAAGEGKDTLSAMAFAIDDGAKNYKERKERTNAILDRLDDAQSAVDTQKAGIASGEIAGADADIRRVEGDIKDARKNALNIRIAMLDTELKLADSAANRKLQAAIQTITARATLEEKDQIGRYTRRWEYLKAKGTPAQAEAAKAELTEFITTTSIPYLQSKLRADTELEEAKMKNRLPGEGGESSGWNVEEAS